MFAPLAALVLLAAVPPARGATDVSAGIACPLAGFPQDDTLCGTLRIATSWSCDASGCTLDIAFSLYNPSGRCTTGGAFGVSVRGWCSAPGMTDDWTVSMGGYDAGRTVALGGFVCIDNDTEAGEWRTECAHWTHVTSPAPGTVEETSSGAGGFLQDSWWETEARARCDQTLTQCAVFTPFVGVGTSPFIP